MKDFDIKNEIKAVIYESGYTLNQVAQELGLSDTSFSNMLSRDLFAIRWPNRLQRLLGMNLNLEKRK